MSSDLSTGSVYRVVLGVLKWSCLAVSLFLCVLALMSLVGQVVDNLWLRLLPALVVAAGLPVVVVERVFSTSTRPYIRGRATDVLALVWLGFALAFIVAGHGYTRPLLLTEGDHLADDGVVPLANVTYWLARGMPGIVGGDVARQVRAMPNAGAPTAADGAPAAGDSLDAEDLDSSTPSADDGDAPTAPVVSPVVESDDPRPELTPAEVLRQLASSIVTISVRGERGDLSGTGFFIDDEGTLITSHQLVDGARAAVVRLADGTWIREVELVAAAPETGLALLRASTQPTIPVQLGHSGDVSVGSHVVYLGNPLGLEPTIAEGEVSGVELRGQLPQMLVSFAMPIADAGGPVVNRQGDVVGVVASAQAGPHVVSAGAVLELVRRDHPDRCELGSNRSQATVW